MCKGSFASVTERAGRHWGEGGGAGQIMKRIAACPSLTVAALSRWRCLHPRVHLEQADIWYHAHGGGRYHFSFWYS